MTDENLIFAIGEIDDSYILSAGKRLEGKRRNRKVLICIAAAIIVLLSSFATAMAVSDDFRDSVLSIFRISETEEVQHSGTSYVGDVEVSYIKADDSYYISNGLAFSKSGVFCIVNDGKLKPLDTKTASIELQHNGVSLSIRYAYTVYNGQLYTVELDTEDMNQNPLMYYRSITPLRGSCDEAWLCLMYESNGDYTQYPLLLNAVTGEVTDILNGIDLSDIICDAWQFSPDNRYAVIISSECDRLVDLESKTVTELENCHNSYFLSDGSLACFVVHGQSFDLVRRDTESNSETVIIKDTNFIGKTSYGSVYLSIGYNGCAGNHALLVDEDGSVTLLDLSSGNRLLLYGISVESDEKLYTLESPDGKSILVAVKTRGESGVFRSLGIINCDEGNLRIFDRENTIDSAGEELMGFMADGSICISAKSEDGQWLYIYNFDGKANAPTGEVYPLS